MCEAAIGEGRDFNNMVIDYLANSFRKKLLLVLWR